jgi:hypothetical protein
MEVLMRISFRSFMVLQSMVMRQECGGDQGKMAEWVRTKAEGFRAGLTVVESNCFAGL